MVTLLEEYTEYTNQEELESQQLDLAQYITLTLLCLLEKKPEKQALEL